MNVFNFYLLTVVFAHSGRFAGPGDYFRTRKRIVPQGNG